MQTVLVDDTHIPIVRTRYKFATVIFLPRGEVIREFAYGDREGWFFNRHKDGDACDIVPQKKRSKAWDGETNLHIITKGGKDYEIDLTEVTGKTFDSGIHIQEPDPPKPMSSCDVGLRMELSTFKETSRVKQAALDSQVEGLQSEVSRRVVPVEFVAALDDNYHISGKLRGAPFSVTKIYSDGQKTYLRSKTPKAEIFERHGKETVHLKADYQDGVYIVQCVLNDGCLDVGDDTACFKRKVSVAKEQGQ